MERDTWIFGYGSLVWRADFPFAARALAWVGGYSRRFWQGSTDHRGVPEAPGRVVTLIRDPGARCLGMAYRLRASDREDVLAHLDHRERGGYERVDVELVFEASPAPGARALLYLATAENPNYLGPAPTGEIAEQIRNARGPSGPNPEYLVELARFLRTHGADEPHVFEIERALGGQQIPRPTGAARTGAAHGGAARGANRPPERGEPS